MVRNLPTTSYRQFRQERREVVIPKLAKIRAARKKTRDAHGRWTSQLDPGKAALCLPSVLLAQDDTGHLNPLGTMGYLAADMATDTEKRLARTLGVHREADRPAKPLPKPTDSLPPKLGEKRSASRRALLPLPVPLDVEALPRHMMEGLVAKRRDQITMCVDIVLDPDQPPEKRRRAEAELQSRESYVRVSSDGTDESHSGGFEAQAESHTQRRVSVPAFGYVLEGFTAQDGGWGYECGGKCAGGETPKLV